VLNLRVQIQPNASKNEIISYVDEILKLRIAAPAIDGKANRKLIEYLSEVFNIPKSNITIKSGLSSKYKIITITGLSHPELHRLLDGKST
jgi:uncharacterized protein